MTISSIFKRFRKGIIIAIALVVIENVAWIVEPMVFGNVIDAVISKANQELNTPFVLPLLVWIIVFLINSGVGTARRSVDQKIYLSMYSHIAFDVVKNGKTTGLSVSEIAGRSELTQEYISFFQYRIPEILEQSIAIVGAITALLFFDWRIALTCFAIILPLSFITKLYSGKVYKLQQNLHDTKEEAYDVYSGLNLYSIKKYLFKRINIEQKVANYGALNFGIMRVFLLGIFLIVLFIAIDLDNFTTGNIYSIVAYLWTFLTSSEYLPELFVSWTSLRELSQRMKLQEA
jgi:ABC-type multidrug transport system fused ATPase/permease subunit